VPGDVHHVVQPAQHPEVAVALVDGSVTGLVHPVLGVGAVGVGEVPPVLLDEPLVVAVHSLKHSRPGLLDDEVARLTAGGLDGGAVVVVERRLDPRTGLARAPGFHVVERREVRDEVAAGLGLPPRVDDDGVLVADVLVVPQPRLRLNGFPDGGHVPEVEVVLLDVLRSPLHEHPNRGRGGVEDVHVVALGDLPDAALVGVVGRVLVHD
jgi:hypothetical protein